MNTEDFVSYSQALSLKKLGFDEKCLFSYNGNKTLIPHHYTCDGTVYTTDLYGSSNKHYYKDKDFCDAPTLAQAQKWLRKEKGLSVEPFSYEKTKWMMDITDLKTGDCPELGNTYISYEEALSDGITKCLKLLEKIKQK